MSCSRTQHSDTGETQTCSHLVSSQALYHCATALPDDLTSAFVNRFLYSIITLISMLHPKKSIFWLVSLGEQTDSSLTWYQTPKTGFLASSPYLKTLNLLFLCICQDMFVIRVYRLQDVCVSPIFNAYMVHIGFICCFLGNFFGLFCHLLIFFKMFFFFFYSFRNTVRVASSLDPDQARCFVRPDLGPNCLQRLSADDTSRQRVQFVSCICPNIPNHQKLAQLSCHTK